MMTLIHLCTLLDHLGVELTARGDRLHYKAENGSLTPEVIDALKAHKSVLLSLLAGAADPPWSPRRPPQIVEEIGRWPVPWRQRWGELCNAFEDSGTPFPESERRAYHQVKSEMEDP
jgi:hypothetical protein